MHGCNKTKLTNSPKSIEPVCSVFCVISAYGKCAIYVNVRSAQFLLERSHTLKLCVVGCKNWICIHICLCLCTESLNWNSQLSNWKTFIALYLKESFVRNICWKWIAHMKECNTFIIRSMFKWIFNHFHCWLWIQMVRLKRKRWSLEEFFQKRETK